jgi:multidrug efflux pump subunit AcrA (membrane-fusion protein)
VRVFQSASDFLKADLAAAQANLKRIDDYLGLGGMQDGAFIVGHLQARDEELAAAQARLAEAERQTVFGIHAEAETRALRAQERAERAERTLAAIRGQRDRLRQALEGLVGGATRDELEQIELGLRLVPAPDEDKAVSLNAIHALLALLDAPPSPEKG